MSLKNIEAVLHWASRGDAPDELEAAVNELAALRRASTALDRERSGLYVMGGEVDEAWKVIEAITMESK